MGKRQIEAEKTRIKLIKAAKKLFDTNNPKNIKVEDITKEAGVAKGTFYTYFKNKEDIIATISGDIFKDLKSNSFNNCESVLEKISSFLIKSIEIIKEAGLGNCKVWLSSGIDPKVVEENPGNDKLFFDLTTISEILEKNSEIEKKDTLAQNIVAQYYGSLTLWCISNGKIDPLMLIEKYCDSELKNYLEK